MAQRRAGRSGMNTGSAYTVKHIQKGLALLDSDALITRSLEKSLLRGSRLGEHVEYVLAKRNETERMTMRNSRCLSCLLATMLSGACFSGEILYQDYLDKYVLLSAQEVEAGAGIIAGLDWNYYFESNSLAVAMKIVYVEPREDGTDSISNRPIVVRYDFNGVHEPVGKSIRRAESCYGFWGVGGFGMVGLDSFLFSYGECHLPPKTAFMRISDSTQTVVDITRDVEGKGLHGALSASERAVFLKGESFAFMCADTNGCSLLLWNKGGRSLWPIPSRLFGYTCLSGGRVLIDVPSVDEGDPYRKEVSARCYQVLPSCDANASPNVYADWDAALSNKVLSLGKGGPGGYDWSIALHGMKGMFSQNELGHEFVEGKGVLYDFLSEKIFRLRKSDSDWQVLDLYKFFAADVDQARDYVPMSILHRGEDSWYYALLFEYEGQGGDSRRRYRIRIVEVPRWGERYFLWSFPDFKTTRNLTTFPLRSPGLVHKLQDDSWVFLSYTSPNTYTNAAIFVQRMTGSREEIHPIFNTR